MVRRVKLTLAPLVAALLLTAALPAMAKNQNDPQVQQKLQQELGKKKQWADVRVIVDDGIATLTGTTKTYSDKQKVERKAEHVDGVRSVINQVQVDAGNVSDQQLGETISDRLRYDRVDEGVIMGVNRNITAGNAFNN